MDESKMREVCEEIQDIMRVYREQEATSYGVDTPGGLEHMGDVWDMLYRWDKLLTAPADSIESAKGGGVT
jgi:hypothetical protein